MKVNFILLPFSFHGSIQKPHVSPVDIPTSSFNGPLAVSPGSVTLSNAGWFSLLLASLWSCCDNAWSKLASTIQLIRKTTGNEKWFYPQNGWITNFNLGKFCSSIIQKINFFIHATLNLVTHFSLLPFPFAVDADGHSPTCIPEAGHSFSFACPVWAAVVNCSAGALWAVSFDVEGRTDVPREPFINNT